LLSDASFFDPGAVACLVAEGQGGRHVGYAVVSSRLFGQPLQPGRSFVHVEVDPPQRSQGVGAQLFDEVWSRAGLAGATSTVCRLDLADRVSRRFAERRGFVLSHVLVRSELELSAFDTERAERASARATAAGVRFGNLADCSDKLAAIDCLYALDLELSLDVPEWSGVMPPYEEYRQSVLGRDPSGIVLAWHGNDLVGLAINEEAEGQVGYSSFMGVRRTHRGLGIALALKGLTARWARGRGYRALAADNNAASEPILALNRSLGYREIGRTALMTRYPHPRAAVIQSTGPGQVDPRAAPRVGQRGLPPHIGSTAP
jgi:GNAT superfamily N-acetyltransferase